MSENDSIFGALIYRAIGEPEDWLENSIEPLVKLLTDEYGMDGPDRLAQVNFGKKIVGKLSEKDTLVSAVMTILDDAKYGLMMIDHDFNAIYYNNKVKGHLNYLLDSDLHRAINPKLRDLIIESTTKLDGQLNNDLIRLDYSCGGYANIYLRTKLKDNAESSELQHLHQLMVVGSGDNSSQICEQVSKAYDLSEREASIVQSAVKALASGGSTKEIAQDLYISPNTVKTHLKSIYAKSGVKSLAALVSLYLQHELQQLNSYFGNENIIHEDEIQSGLKTVNLIGGQTIAYKEYGDANGRPLVILHNSYSSRLNIPPGGDAIAKKFGRRIIIPDRPGYGKTRANDFYPESWSQMLMEFTEQLGLLKFDLLANALIVRHALEFVDQFPEKVNKLIFTAPLLHVPEQNTKNFSEWFAVSTELFEKSPELSAEIYRLWHSSAALRLDDHIEKNFSTSVSSEEKELIDNSEFIAVLKNNFRESAAQQSKGSTEDFIYCFNKCTLDLTSINTETEIWFGDEDGLCSPMGVRAVFDSLPNKVYFELKGFGEHIYYSQFEKIISIKR